MGQRGTHTGLSSIGQGDCICRMAMLLTKLSRKEHNVPKKRNRSIHILQNGVICLRNYIPSWNNFLEHDGTWLLLIYLTLKHELLDS